MDASADQTSTRGELSHQSYLALSAEQAVRLFRDLPPPRPRLLDENYVGWEFTAGLLLTLDVEGGKFGLTVTGDG